MVALTRPRRLRGANQGREDRRHALGRYARRSLEEIRLALGQSGITASTRQPLGVIREDADMRALVQPLMYETIAVGRAVGVEFPPDFLAELDHLVAAFAPADQGFDGERPCGGSSP